MSLVFQGLQVYAKMGRAPRTFFSYTAELASANCFFPMVKKKVHENFGNDWKAQEIFHCKISTETPIRNKFLPSCLILLEYTLRFYDSHILYESAIPRLPRASDMYSSDMCQL